ncbi:AAA family ATPase [Vibrio vulnificus]|uniref:AAA family ATPase n=1 Tax=Vibrio vulnificus TaxID=672 RepID=UPI001CDBB896|nr:AAA family ATPase [Vibrio vulnificus]MCA4014313.1 AAA family ATPase [Vibrio vulnificus]
MKLLSLKLNGQYKGLKDQYFDFSRSQGNIVALIGLNGSGKSQLLEVIAEAFAFLERCQRDDFVVRTPLGFGFELVYEIAKDDLLGNIWNVTNKFELDESSCLPKVFQQNEGGWEPISIEDAVLPHVVGYSSGLNENLQRSFMKNAVQFFEVQRIRLKYMKEFRAAEIGLLRNEVNQKYLDKYPHAFSSEAAATNGFDDFTPLRHAAIQTSKSIYLDYDSAGLVLASLAILPAQEIEQLFSEVTFKHPVSVTLQYDLRGGVTDEADASRDIKRLISIAGPDQFKPAGRPATEEQFDLYELEYLAGDIKLDLANPNVVSALREANYGDPIAFFNRLYKLQQLGIKKWQYSSRLLLQKDNFQGTVKKPLKTKLPLSVSELILSDGQGRTVCLDDLSDGEAQLIEALAVTRIFSAERTLFLFDEPETHLNPSWRTYYHRYLSKAIVDNGNDMFKSSVILSTHSPFMVSSLKRENVLFFKRDENGSIQMSPVNSQTYGASFEVLIKQHFGLRSLISQTVVEAVKELLPKDESSEAAEKARDWIESNLGDSMEKAYLLRKLQS